MQPLDNNFFEEYKRLDRICSDMYSSRNGVSQYISDMESKSRRGEYAVPNWRLVYRDLVHLRHLRIQIAHESGDYPFCTEEDIETLRELSHKILTQQDPLSLLYQYEIKLYQNEQKRSAGRLLSNGTTIPPRKRKLSGRRPQLPVEQFS